MRLFVGVPVPLEIAAVLAHASSKFPAGFRPSPTEQMHVTLSFLGETAAERLPCITRELDEVRLQAFDVKLVGIGTFPGVAFAKLAEEAKLHSLAAEVVQQMERCGFPAEPRPYHPHVTLARSRDRRLKIAPGPFRPLDFMANEFVLYRSFLGPQGSRYEHVRRFALIP